MRDIHKQCRLDQIPFQTSYLDSNVQSGALQPLNLILDTSQNVITLKFNKVASKNAHGMANSADLGQTAPVEAILSGAVLFAWV